MVVEEEEELAPWVQALVRVQAPVLGRVPQRREREDRRRREEE